MSVVKRYTGTDWEVVGSGAVTVGALIAEKSYQPAAEWAIPGASLSDIDATNLAVTFTAPASGKVFIEVEVGLYSTSGLAKIGLREGTTAVTAARPMTNGSAAQRYVTVFGISGLTPGSSHTYKLAAATTGTGTVWVNGGVDFPITLKVYDAAIGVSPSGVTSSGLTVISDQTLAAAAATIDFSSIPSTYAELRLVFQGRSDRAATADTLVLRINNDSAANYRTFWGSVDSASGFMPIGEIPAASGTAGTPGQSRIEMVNYAGTTFHKTMLSHSGDTNGNTEESRVTYGRWFNTAAVNRLTLLTSTGSNFVAGTRAILYGIG